MDRARSPGVVNEALWNEVEPEVAHDRAIYQRFANGVDEAALMEDLGRFSDRIIHRFRQWSNEDHHRFFAELALLHREFQDFGAATYGKSSTAAIRASAVRIARVPSPTTNSV